MYIVIIIILIPYTSSNTWYNHLENFLRIILVIMLFYPNKAPGLVLLRCLNTCRALVEAPVVAS